MDGRLNPTRFPVFLLKPSHYDDDAYVIRWRRSVIPSNTLAALYGLVSDCADRRVLGDDVAIECHGIDETNSPIDVHRITREITGAGGGLVAMVGVQSNQYSRALDLAREFRQAKIPVAIGGFHVSGCLAMLPGVPPDLQEAIDLGVSLFSGEAEEGLDEVLRDAASGTVRLIYDHLKDPLKSPPLGLLDRMLVIGRPENTASSS